MPQGRHADIDEPLTTNQNGPPFGTAPTIKRLAATRQAFLLSFYYLPVEADDAYLEGDIFAALCEGSFGSHFQTAAARDFHEDFIKGRITLIGCPKLDTEGRMECVKSVVPRSS